MTALISMRLFKHNKCAPFSVYINVQCIIYTLLRPKCIIMYTRLGPRCIINVAAQYFPSLKTFIITNYLTIGIYMTIDVPTADAVCYMLSYVKY